ncbi:chloride channel protein [Rhodopila globiformis]|uniref:Chloride channel protein n=1 Tax=Rhodopila globiformis TaxID=1071 RepID=A0A2S6N3C6_RHOGL|nr:chloride channel protein [Rhodopila globiformis]PPQ29131.1 chloride channel protein [Rhodopila globiformis]
MDVGQRVRPMRLRRMGRMPLVSPRLWWRRLVFWVGAILVSCIAVTFAQAANWATEVFLHAIAGRAWLAFIIAPAGLAISFLLTQYVFPGAQGSGIPQTIAALHMHDQAMVGRVLSLRIAVGKILLTLLGLASGASIGREGPTVQVGASIMHALGNLLRLPRPELQRALVLAGGAAGIAGAFNTPLAGIVFAIEELSHSFEARTSGTVFTAVIIAGATTLGLVGNYTYFGQTSAEISNGPATLAVILCSVVGGLAGGIFSQSLLIAAKGLPGVAGRLIMRYPVVFAALCGLSLAVIGWLSGGQTYGTGYDQARAMVEEHSVLPPVYAALKLAATVVSYVSGIPGGIFAPSLSIGAAMGSVLAPLVPNAPVGAMILLGMTAYFSGVVQAPITATVIVMEMTANQSLTIPLMATAFLSFAMSRLICRRPLYGALARRFLEVQRRH